MKSRKNDGVVPFTAAENFFCQWSFVLATGWTVRRSNTGGGEIFCTCPDRSWGPPSLLYNGYRVLPGGKKRPGRDVDPSPLSSAVGHERVVLDLYPPLWALRPVQSLSACTRVQKKVNFCTARYIIFAVGANVVFACSSYCGMAVTICFHSAFF